MMIHQDGSRHEWVPEQLWDLIVTMDNAASWHYSMFFVEEEGTFSSFRGVGEVIAGHGLLGSFYSDRGSHYWTTPEADGKVDRAPRPSLRACPAAVGHHHDSRLFPEHGSLRALAHPVGALAAGVGAGGHHRYRPVPIATCGTSICRRSMPSSASRRWSRVRPSCRGSAAAWRTSCASSMYRESRQLRALRGPGPAVPADRHRCHYVKARVRVHRYPSGALAIFHGPGRLAYFTPEGKPITDELLQAA